MDTHAHQEVIETSGFWPALHLTDGISIPTYYLIISLAFCLAIVWLVIRADRFRLSRQSAIDIALAVMFGGFIGARLFHILFEYPDHYWEHPADTFKFWQGGFVYYGGLIGASLLAGLVMIRKNLSPGAWLDLFAPIGAGGYAMGRLACFFNGCCYGSVCETSWLTFRHPTQLYAVVWESAVMFLLLMLENRRARLATATTGLQGRLAQPGNLFWAWLFFHGWGRIVMEYFRDDFRGFQPFGISIATWISIGLILLSADFFFNGYFKGWLSSHITRFYRSM